MKTVEEIAQEYADEMCTPSDEPADGTYKDINEYLKDAFLAGYDSAKRERTFFEDYEAVRDASACSLPIGRRAAMVFTSNIKKREQ
jgi:hypothetical protein